MNVFCDSSVFVAASLENHPHHEQAFALLLSLREQQNRGFTSAHALIETFSVLSRMPTNPKLKPEDVLQILEANVIPYFTLVVVSSDDYLALLRDFATKEFSGGAIYDFLHLAVARKLALDSIHTFNEAEWRRLAPDLVSIISAPR
jgi:predicted nucleic acid-binding protein